MIKYFSLKIGSVFKNSFFFYEVYFLKNKIKVNDKWYSLSKNDSKFLKEKIRESKCINYNNSYVNRLKKDGIQWNLCVKTLLKNKNVHGDNLFPDNWKIIEEITLYVQNILKEE